MSYVLIVGAKSDIAKALAKEYAKNGYSLYLAARNHKDLEGFSTDLKIRTDIEVNPLELDVLNYNSHEKFYTALKVKPLGVIFCTGYLGNQKRAQVDFKEVENIINTNYTGIVSLANIIANDFEKRREGFIIGLSSVAADRGRQSNYLYGSAKAAFSAYLSGLRNRLSKSHVHVLTVKPGFVATKMTKGLNLPKRLTAKPEEVAKDIFYAHKKGKNTLYTKWFWKWIMLIIKSIPEFQFKKMSL